MIYMHYSFYIRDRVVTNIITTYVPNQCHHYSIYAKEELKHVTYV